MVKEVTSASDFDNELNKAGGKLVVVDFHAVWCGPCKAIKPVYEALASQNTSAVFLKVDVDQVQAVAQRYSVRAMPTFLFLKNRSVVETLQGADPQRLRSLVQKHASSASSAFSGSGQTLSGSSSSAAGTRTSTANPIRGITEGHASLVHLVEISRSGALNEQAEHPLRHALGESGRGLYLESDADEQLIVQLSFKQKVKLSAILLRTAPTHTDSAPREVKVFANRPNLDFEDATNEEPTQALQLVKADVEDTEESGGGRTIPLRFVKFQDVTSIAVAILSNQGDQETTRIDAIDVFGVASETTNMNDLQKLEAQGFRSPPDGRGPSKTGLKGGSARGGAGAPSYFTSQPVRPSMASQGRPLSSPTSVAMASARDDLPSPKARRRGSTASAASFVDSETGSARTAPPFVSQEEEEEFDAAGASPESFGGWHYVPLIIALVPPIGAVIGGRADAWSDAILLFLSSFWLYQFLRVPWDLYYSARTRRVLSHDYAEESEEERDQGDVDASFEGGPGSRKTSSSPTSEEQRYRDVEREQARQAAAAELRRSELVSLLFCILSPLIGAYLLSWIRATMVDGGRYLNAFNLRLFTLAAGIKPWSHAIRLIRQRIVHLQEEVHYPNSKVEVLNTRLRRLEADLGGIRRMIATKNDIRILRDVDAQLGRAVRRSEKKEEHLRLSAEDKFHEVENRLEDLLREVAINAELIEEERKERERATQLRISLMDAVKFLLGAGITIRGASTRHYLHDAPRTLPSSTSLGVGTGSPTSEPPFYNGYPTLSRQSSHVQQSAQQGSPPRSQAHTVAMGSAPVSSVQSQPTGPGRGSMPRHPGSPTLDSHVLSRYYERNGVASVSDPWWEQGLAFYLFLPLNVSSAAIRFAGEKVRHILEDSDEYSLQKQRSQFGPAAGQPSAGFGAQKMRTAPVHGAGPKLVKQSSSRSSRRSD